jgi:uncharacterized damage-inducible protein DinB
MDSAALLRHYRRERRGTRLLVSAIPDELFDWVPEGSGFSLGGLVRHLIQAEAFWRRLLQAAAEGEEYDPFGLSGEAAERMERFRPMNEGASNDERLGKTAAECLETWSPVQSKTEAFLGSLTESQLAGARIRHPLLGLEESLGQSVLIMVAHEVHHRGQLSAYLKMHGVEQPTALWTPEENE